MSGSTHKHRYKNSALDSVELRRRREEEGVQLRKQKRELQLYKRRNVNLNALPPDDSDALQVGTQFSFIGVCRIVFYYRNGVELYVCQNLTMNLTFLTKVYWPILILLYTGLSVNHNKRVIYK